MHPSSVNANVEARNGLYVYLEKPIYSFLLILLMSVLSLGSETSLSGLENRRLSVLYTYCCHSSSASLTLNSQPLNPLLLGWVHQVETSRLFLRETTWVPPRAVVLFGATSAELDLERVKQTGRVRAEALPLMI